MAEVWKKMTEGFNQKTGMTKFKQKTKEVFNKSAKTKDEQFEERQAWVNQSVGLVAEQYGNVEQFYINTECK